MMKRREFLAAGAATAWASAALTHHSLNSLTPSLESPVRSDLQDEPETRLRLKKAVKIGMVRIEGSLADKFQLLNELGYDGVELDSPGGPEAEEVLAAVEQTGLAVHGVVNSIHWQKTLSDPDPAVRAEGVEGMQTALRAANAYGASSVLLVPGRVDGNTNYEQCWERSIAEIRKVLPLAEELEIDILIENVWNNFLIDPHEMARYLDEIDHPRVGAYYDVGNSVRYANPVIWIRALGERIKKLDIKEFDLDLARESAGAGFRANLLEGTTGWADVLRELIKLDFRGWGTAEVAGGGPERLADIAERMDRIYSLQSLFE